MAEIINSPEIDTLATIVEEGSRAAEAGVTRFIEPAYGTLRRARSKRHHIVFGRRGSGKTSLLRKAADDLKTEGRPIAYVDLEPFKGNYYPDVLLSVLLASLKSFREWVNEAKPEKRIIHINLFGKRRVNPKTKLFEDIGKIIVDLETQLHEADQALLEHSKGEGKVEAVRGEFRAGIKSELAEVSGGAAEYESEYRGQEVRETYRRSKIDFLHRRIIDYQAIFKELAKHAGGDAYLFLDDLYHIRKQDQPQLLDYFHRISKGNNVWLKVGTIRRRSNWYVHGDPPIGLKLGDDADEIDLDLTLERYGSAKAFLIAILDGFIKEAAAPPVNGILADGAIERLVLASGGVARDFLGIFRRSIDETRERIRKAPLHYRGGKIGAEDVNLAVGSYGDIKQEEFQRDSLEDRDALEQAFNKVRDFCIQEANANCFLVDQSANDEESDLIEELMDLRLLHLVRSRVTVSRQPGRVYRAYMLDLSQYVGARARRELDILEFWRRGAEERLRRVSLIYR